MKLKNILKTTALFTLISSSSFSAFADTQKMYGIQGDSLSITTTVQAPQSYEVNGKHTPRKVMKRNPIQKKGQQAITTINLMVVKQLMVNAIIRHCSPLPIKTLPLNSYAVVTNLHNNRKVIVRINDRGPFSEKRIIDLSILLRKNWVLLLVVQGK